MDRGETPHSMAIDKEAARGDWTPWTPFCKRSMDSSQPDLPQPNWPGTGETCGGSYQQAARSSCIELTPSGPEPPHCWLSGSDHAPAQLICLARL